MFYLAKVSLHITMNHQQKFSLQKRIKSFGFAFNGLKILIRNEHNARIHLFAAVFVIIAGLFLHLALFEWIAVFLSIGMVFSLEIINSAIETISDFISPEKNPQIKKVKDLSAAAVLIGVFTSLIVGIIILLPKFKVLFW